MSINHLSVQTAASTYIYNSEAARSASAAAAGKNTNAQQAPKADSVSLSADARALAKAHDAVKNAADVREDKIADIKQRVSDGTYNVSARALARKLLDTINQ